MIGAAATVLIVDDEPQNLKLLENLLLPQGYRILGAANGSEALALVGREAPDLILLDALMPGMDGFRVASLLKGNPATSSIPIIMVTALNDRSARMAGLNAGVEDFLTKPVNRAELWLRVRNLLRLKALGDAQKNQTATLEREVNSRAAELQLFREAMDSTADAIFLLNRTSMRFVEVNATACRMLGYSRAELLEMGPEALVPATVEQLAGFYDALIAGKGELAVAEFRFQRKNGTRFLAEVHRHAHHTGTGWIIVAVVHDISLRRQAEGEIQKFNQELEGKVAARTADLEQARHEADLANQAKSSFLSTMSHEIRTPMNGVIGMIDVLIQTRLNEHQVEIVELIRDSAFSLLNIIEDILDFSRIEAGQLAVERAPLVFAEVLEKSCGMMEELAERKGVELTLFIDPAIPVQVLGDALRFHQVLTNLLSNAIKFSSGRSAPGRVSVRASLADRSPDRVQVLLQVTDNGIGMDAATQAKLFRAFSQADISTTRRFGGSGLGLAISRHLVQLQGGNIEVESAPDVGTSFRVRLPFEPCAAPAVQPEGADRIQGLCCICVGGTAFQAEDLAAYLGSIGAQVERVADLGAAGHRLGLLAPGPWIWIIDTGGAPNSAAELDAVLGTRPDITSRYVVVDRLHHRRLQPRLQDANLVSLDGHLLTLRKLLKALSLLAGQPRDDRAAPLPVRPVGTACRPSRDEALRQGRLLLVAEDNETNQKVIMFQLALLGFAADLVGDGREALDHWKKGRYALLLADLQMPGMDGYELCAAIRAAEKGSEHLPIVALTANALKGESQRCLAAGMDGYLSKPVPLKDLQIALQRWLPADGPGIPVPAAAVPQAGGPSPVDLGILKALVRDDPAVIRDCIQVFRVSAARTAGALQAAFDSGQPGKASALAHKLKGSARSVGALALGELCAEMEQASTAAGIGGAGSVWPRLSAEMAAVDQYLGSL